MKKATHQTDRNEVTDFRQIMNIGPSIAADFQRLGLKRPQQLAGKDPLRLYRKICSTDGKFHDPCVLDCFISAVEFMDGNPPQKWWSFTAGRKKKYARQIDSIREQYDGG